MSEISARCFLFVGNISATICKNLIFKIFYLVRKVFLICAKSDIFDEDVRFKEQGGFKKIDRVFQNQLESIVLELNTYLYDDGGKTA